MKNLDTLLIRAAKIIVGLLFAYSLANFNETLDERYYYHAILCGLVLFYASFQISKIGGLFDALRVKKKLAESHSEATEL